MGAQMLDPRLREAIMAENSEVKFVTAAVTLEPWETEVFCKEPASSTYAITLPPPSKAKGRMFYVELVEADDGTVTVTGQGVGTDYTSDALTAVGDFVLVYCTGRRYLELKELTT
jgi:hypothetical protein